jgi:antitoxin component HigA of HigAB toxin-antitoxin module
MATRTRTAHITDDYFELIKQFPLVPISDDRHLKEAHKVIDELSIINENDLTEGQSAYLAVLGDLTSAYESPAIDEMTRNVCGLDVLKHLMEEHGMTGSDIGRIVGQRELGSKLLKGDRQISKEHSKLLGQHFSVPPEIFLRD